MAIPSNRSPSPVTSRANPDSRPQENIRKSFNGNPLAKPSRSFNPTTPANSPADYSRRNLGSKEAGLRGSYEFKEGGLRSSYEFKENDKEQKKAKEGQVTKSTKSFMAPTISAISKISPSPRKKVLAERNEMVRSSISDLKSLIDVDLSGVAEDDTGSQVVSEPENSSLKPRAVQFQEVEVDSSASQVVSEPQNRTFRPKVVRFQEVEVESSASVISESVVEEIVAEPHVTIKPSPSSQPCFAFSAGEETPFKSNSIAKPSASPSPSLAPIDTDPLFTKYESKIRSASPSLAPKPPLNSPAMAPLDSDPHLPPYDPKTNYLSPRPRFLHYRPKPRVEISPNKDGDVASGEGKNLEDSFSSESSSDADATEETPSSPSPKESEDGSYCELLSEEEDRQPLVSEVEAETTQLKENPKSKSRSFARAKIVPFVLVFALACFFIPITDTPDLSPGHTFKFEGTVKENFNELASNLKLWSAKTVSYLSTVVSLPSVLEERAPFHFSNSTIFNREPLVYDEFPLEEVDVFGKVNDLDQIDMEAELETETEEMPMEEEDNVELPTFDEVDVVVAEADNHMELEEQHALIEPETVQEVEVYEEEKLDSDTYTEPVPTIQVIPESSELDSSNPIENSESIHDFAPSLSLETSSPVISSELDATPLSPKLDTLKPAQGLEQDIVPNEQLDALISGVQVPVNLFQLQNIVGIVCAVLTIGAAYLYAKLNKATIPKIGNTSEKVTEKKMASRLSASGDSEDRFSSRPTVVDMGGDSGPSEMSSSFKRSATSDRVNEAHSNEKRLRYSNKEALPSSSEYSYGSFTTYEKIHSRHGYGEDEVVTPVRRSSRIRKITSP